MIMKSILPLLLTALLLCGCAAQNTQPQETLPVLAPVSAEPEEVPTQSAIASLPVKEEPWGRQYSLSADIWDFLFLQENLLLFSGGETTRLSLLNPETMETLAVHEVPFGLSSRNATLQLLDNGLSYFHGQIGETVILDNLLREIRRIHTPEDLTGMPLLSPDSNTLYYCTASAVRALDISSGISRILKESTYPVQGLSGILLDGTVLQMSITDTDGSWRTLFLSSENGQLLQECEGNILPEAATGSYLLQTTDMILFGQADGSTMLLHPRQADADAFFLPDVYGAVCVSSAEDMTTLDCYDLYSGSRTAELNLPGTFSPANLVRSPDGSIWFLNPLEEVVLCRWYPEYSITQDDSCYSSPFYTRSEPDYEGLAACSLYAQELSETYGMDILVYKDAVALEPWDYHLDYEYQPSILRRELEALDRNLRIFPEEFLQTLRNKFTALKICIVRSATGSPESGSLEAVNGIQFMDGFDAYIVLATDHDTQYALYHELSHLMETVVLTESVAYDRWDNLNPSDFRYDNDYLSNQYRDGSPWMKPGKEYFIDTYSMSFAKEDRARLFEYAMTPGHETLFQSPNLQAKLRQLCLGIREGFGLERSEETFLWEQYLAE